MVIAKSELGNLTSQFERQLHAAESLSSYPSSPLGTEGGGGEYSVRVSSAGRVWELLPWKNKVTSPLSVAGFTGSLPSCCERYHKNKTLQQLTIPRSHSSEHLVQGETFHKVFQPHNKDLRSLPTMWCQASVFLFLLTQAHAASSPSAQPYRHALSHTVATNMATYIRNSWHEIKFKSHFPLLVTLQVWPVSQWLP